MSSPAAAVVDLAFQTLRLGPLLNAKIAYAATVGLPLGLPYAGGEAVRVGVEADAADGMARLTTIMANLGDYVMDLIVKIICLLVDRERTDVVAEVTLGMLRQNELVNVTKISNAMVAAGEMGKAMKIAGELANRGNTQVLDSLKKMNEKPEHEKNVLDRVGDAAKGAAIKTLETVQGDKGSGEKATRAEQHNPPAAGHREL